MEINQVFAKRYESYRRKEELSHKKGPRSRETRPKSLEALNAEIEKISKPQNADEDDSNSTSSDSSYGEDDIARMNRHADAILAALRSNNATILEGKLPTISSSSEGEDAEESENSDKNMENVEKDDNLNERKPMYLKDYERKFILEKGGVPEYSSSSDEEHEEENLENEKTLLPPSSGLTKTSHEKKRTSSSSSSDTSDDEIDEDAQQSQHHKSLTKDNWFPTDLFFSISPPRDEGSDIDDWKNVVPMTSVLLKAYASVESNFAQKYNFSKEEMKDMLVSDDEDEENKFSVTGLRPAYRAQDVPHYASKGLPSSTVPGKGMSRAEKRRLRKEAKAAAKAATLNKLTEEKQLRMDELRERATRIRRVCGKSGISLVEALREDYLDKDWDPQEHEKLLMEMFGDEYYALDEDDNDTKPVFTSDSELDQFECEEELLNEADVNEGDPDAAEVGLSSIRSNKRRDRRHKKKKKKSQKGEENVSQNDKVLTSSVYVSKDLVRDEQNQLRPCRFPYRRVKPINYGLTTEEILNADVKELNSWCSIKKVVGYRDDEEEDREAQYYNSVKMQKRKARLLPSIFQPKEVDQESSTSAVVAESNINDSTTTDSAKSISTKGLKRSHPNAEETHTIEQKETGKKKKKQKHDKQLDRPALSESRAAALGFNPKTYKYLPLDGKK